MYQHRTGWQLDFLSCNYGIHNDKFKTVSLFVDAEFVPIADARNKVL